MVSAGSRFSRIASISLSNGAAILQITFCLHSARAAHEQTALELQYNHTFVREVVQTNGKALDRIARPSNPTHMPAHYSQRPVAESSYALDDIQTGRRNPREMTGEAERLPCGGHVNVVRVSSRKGCGNISK